MWYRCRGRAVRELPARPETYHIRHRPSSTRTHGEAVRYGSTSFRSSTGACETRSNVRPPSVAPRAADVEVERDGDATRPAGVVEVERAVVLDEARGRHARVVERAELARRKQRAPARTTARRSVAGRDVRAADVRAPCGVARSRSRAHAPSPTVAGHRQRGVRSRPRERRRRLGTSKPCFSQRT